MLKFIALIILLWILFKAIRQIFKSLIGGEDSNRKTRFTNSGRRSHKGNINVDHDPKNPRKGYDGGEYVDYEEVD